MTISNLPKTKMTALFTQLNACLNLRTCDLFVRNAHLEKQWPLALRPSEVGTIWLMVPWPIYSHNIFDQFTRTICLLCADTHPIIPARLDKESATTTFIVSTHHAYRITCFKNIDTPSRNTGSHNNDDHSLLITEQILSLVLAYNKDDKGMGGGGSFFTFFSPSSCRDWAERREWHS